MLQHVLPLLRDLVHGARRFHVHQPGKPRRGSGCAQRSLHHRPRGSFRSSSLPGTHDYLEAVDIQWSPHPARSNWVASTSTRSSSSGISTGRRSARGSAADKAPSSRLHPQQLQSRHCHLTRISPPNAAAPTRAYTTATAPFRSDWRHPQWFWCHPNQLTLWRNTFLSTLAAAAGKFEIFSHRACPARTHSSHHRYQLVAFPPRDRGFQFHRYPGPGSGSPYEWGGQMQAVVKSLRRDTRPGMPQQLRSSSTVPASIVLLPHATTRCSFGTIARVRFLSPPSKRTRARSTA